MAPEHKLVAVERLAGYTSYGSREKVVDAGIRFTIQKKA
jgi:hypothetical protein